MPRYLHVGGVVAMGFDATGAYLLVVSHSGRGVFCTKTWERIARDYSLVYPDGGGIAGFGPLEGQIINLQEMDYALGTVELTNDDLGVRLEYAEGTITVSDL